MNSIIRNTAAAFAFGLVLGAPVGIVSAASSDHRTFDGVITAVSKINIKVKGTEGGKMQTLSFLFKPPVGGKQTHDMSRMSANAVHVGEYVRVTYDQKLLGLRHADFVAPYGDPAMKMKN